MTVPRPPRLSRLPRLLDPLLRTRTRAMTTIAVVVAALVGVSLPWALHRAGLGESIPAAGQHTGTGRDAAAAVAEARRTRRQVLVDTATTENTQVWARPDGTLQAQIHAFPQRARTPDGRWAAIDTRVVRDTTTRNAAGSTSTTGLGLRAANTPMPVRLSAGTTTNTTSTSTGIPAGHTVLAEVTAGGHPITYTWPGRLPTPVVDGSRALYPEVFRGVDLLAVALPEGGFGQVLIVKTRAAAADPALKNLVYGLSSPTARFRHDTTTGGVQVLDPNGTAVAVVPTPFAWDSAGRIPGERTPSGSTSGTTSSGAAAPPATTEDVLALPGLSGIEPGTHAAPMPTRLDSTGAPAGSNSVLLHLDVAATGLLTAADTRFPLFLDPTLSAATKAWTLVSKRYPNSNFLNGNGYNGSTTEARVGYESDTGVTARSFWRMGFNPEMKGATVSSATFKVLNTHSWSCTKKNFNLYNTGAISSGTTWNKQPAWKALQDTVSFANGHPNCADGGDYVSFDVKQGTQAAADAGNLTFTVGMRAANESDTSYWRKFDARSAVLTAVYNTPPSEPTGGKSNPGGACDPEGIVVAKTNIVLSATAKDADGNLAKLRFRFWKVGGTVPTGTLVSTAANGTASLTIPTTTLADATTYSWDVRAEDSSNAVSTFFPPGTTPCRITVDATKPPAPDVTSDVFKEATPDGATWATVKFGGKGPVTFTAEDAVKFSYSLEGIGSKDVAATNGKATVPDLAPRHAGPTYLLVYAYDAAGNRSEVTSYPFYVPPRDTGDGPGDTGGDGIPDLVAINDNGRLRTYPGDTGGELFGSLSASYNTNGTFNPDQAKHFWDATAGEAALITKYADAYPGDGITDLWVRTPTGDFYLYPGDGYGSFNVDDRISVMLPSNTPDPATWTRIKAVGDITGDQLPDLILQAGTAFWTLTGYTGASFQQATLMEGTAWAASARELLTVADVDVDGTPDLLYRGLSSGNIIIRHGNPGTTTGSVDLNSLKLSANSRDGDTVYATAWTPATVSAVIAVPDTNGDRIPDLWTRSGTDGTMRIHYGTKTAAGAPKTVISGSWAGQKAFA